MRSHPRIDADHTDIVAGLRAAGHGVVSLASIGHGCPDLLVGVRAGRERCSHCGRRYADRRNVLIEIKTAKGTLTEDQVEFGETWPGGEIVIVRTLNEALRATGIK